MWRPVKFSRRFVFLFPKEITMEVYPRWMYYINKTLFNFNRKFMVAAAYSGVPATGDGKAATRDVRRRQCCSMRCRWSLVHVVAFSSLLSLTFLKVNRLHLILRYVSRTVSVISLRFRVSWKWHSYHLLYIPGFIHTKYFHKFQIRGIVLLDDLRIHFVQFTAIIKLYSITTKKIYYFYKYENYINRIFKI